MISYIFLVRAALVAFVVAGGGLGWWYGTRQLYVRELGAPVFGDEPPPLRVRIWHQVRRLLWTGAGAVAGLILGQVAFRFLAGFLA